MKTLMSFQIRENDKMCPTKGEIVAKNENIIVRISQLESLHVYNLRPSHVLSVLLLQLQTALLKLKLSLQHENASKFNVHRKHLESE